ncbi:response regulator [Candidatus Wolfebacteria bacterium]|nr:response regulator [Candidatus Wolfebacteria bacterium]
MDNKAPTHILIIDEDPQMRRLFGGKLALENFEIFYAKDGLEGREMARRFRPDLILLDLNIPKVNGIELAERLKREQETKDIPIVFLTNSDLTLESQKAAKEMGVSDYIQKGIDLDEFVIRVKKIIGFSIDEN